MSGGSWWKRTPKRKPVATAPAPVGPIRVTDGCVNRGYAYWPACVVETDGSILVFVGQTDGQVRFFRIDRQNQVSQLGQLIPFTSTGEGWFWTASGDVTLCDGPRLLRVNPFTGEQTILMDVSATNPGCRLWQAHSSDDGRFHSGTIERITDSGPYERLGTIVQFGRSQQFIEARGTLDESHLTSNGSHLIIEEDNGNRIIDLSSLFNLSTWAETRLTNAEGALSHIDCGPGYAVGEDDQRGACTWLDLRTLERRVLVETWRMGVVSVRAGRCLLSDATKFNISLVALDGSGVTPLVHHGIDASGDYDRQVRASLSPCGTVASYVADGALYVLRVP